MKHHPKRFALWYILSRQYNFCKTLSDEGPRVILGLSELDSFNKNWNYLLQWLVPKVKLSLGSPVLQFLLPINIYFSIARTRYTNSVPVFQVKVQVYTEVSRLVMLLLFYIHFPATIFSLKSIKFKRKSLTIYIVKIYMK